MATDDGKEKSRANREVQFGSDIYETILDSLAEVLALRVTAKEAGRQVLEVLEEQYARPGATPLGLPSGTELRNLAFDLAQLHVQSIRDLTKIGRHHTDFLRHRLDARKTAKEKASEDASRREVLVTLQFDQQQGGCVGTFHVVNATSSRETVAFPQVVTFRSSDGKETFFASPTFAPARPTLGAGEDVEIAVTIRKDALPGPGTYLAQGPVRLGAAMALELFFQVKLPSESQP
jgi:hypothetical protein